MTADQIGLDAATKAFRAVFTSELEDNSEGPLVGALTMRTRSKAKEVQYDWLNAFDELREWVGEREIANMGHESHTVPNVKYESTLSVDRVDIESDSLGLYAPRLAGMVSGFFRKRRRIIADLLDNGATAGNNSYDGVSFFNAAHPSDGNGGTQSNYDNSLALTGPNFDTVVERMENFVDHRGNKMGIVPDTLVVSSDLRATARNLFQTSTDFDNSNAGNNPYFGAVRVIVDSYLASGSWYLFDTSHGLKPFILQEADDLEFVTHNNPNTSDYVFLNDEYLYGTRSRFGVGYGMWQLAYRADE